MRQAVAALGGEAELRHFLGVSADDLARWLRDRQAEVPLDVIHKVVTLLADVEAGLIQSSAQSQQQPRLR